MKKMVLIIVLFLCSFSFAQEIEITNKHVGVFNSVTYDENMNITNDADIRIAAGVIVKKDSVVSFCFRSIFVNPGNSFAQFWIQEKYKDLTFKAGLMPRPISLNRDSPVDHGAQFEPKGTTVIPGGTTGMVVVQKIDALSVSAGTYYLASSKSIEYNGSVEMKFDGTSVLAAGFYSREKYGIAGTVKCKYGRITGYWDSENTISGVAAVNIGSYGTLFCTGIYDYITKKPSHFQFGWVRDFSIPVTVLSEKVELQYLAGFGYVTTDKKLNAYLWIYF